MGDISKFVAKMNWDKIPIEVQSMVKKCLIDTLGVALSGHRTTAAKIAKEVAKEQFGASKFSNSKFLAFSDNASVTGAAMAGAFLIDSVDAHDGHSLAKGHAGATIVPALIAFANNIYHQGGKISGKFFLEALLIGYEVSLRNGIIMHTTSSEYHSSGSWTAIGTAAMGSYLCKLSAKKTKHSLGIAEYHGPRSPMMRCIDYPTMLKDGAGFGALAGTSAVFFAKKGFSGEPAILIKNANEKDYFVRYEILKQYFKPWPVCRWAQPAVQAVSDLKKDYNINYENIKKVIITTFHNASRLNNNKITNTEQAQYSIGYPVAAMLIFGKLTVTEISNNLSSDNRIQKLQNKIKIIESSKYNNAFPKKRYASVEIIMNNGVSYKKSDVQAKGDYDYAPLTDKQIDDKFYFYSKDYLSKTKAEELNKTIKNLENYPDISMLLDMVCGTSKI